MISAFSGHYTDFYFQVLLFYKRLMQLESLRVWGYVNAIFEVCVCV